MEVEGVSRPGILVPFQNSPEATEETKLTLRPGRQLSGGESNPWISEYEPEVQATTECISIFVLQAHFYPAVTSVMLVVACRDQIKVMLFLYLSV
jgi:hypothetical protein